MASFDWGSDIDIEDIFGNSDESEDEYMGFNEDETRCNAGSLRGG